MVTWGNNTVHPIPGAPAPAAGGAAAPAFGAPPAAPGANIFGAPSPAPAFGAPATPTFGAAPATPAFGAAPAPGTSLFGTPSPAGGGLFGAPAPASGGLFGAPAPAPGTSLFGPRAPAPFGSVLGSPAPAPFGQPQQQQQPQIPAQAALHAHMEAINRAETEKLKAELSKLHATYAGQVAPLSSSEKNFVSIVYNELTSEQRQLQWMKGIGVSGKVMPVAPPRPPQVSEEDWYHATVQNPDPANYMPVALVGAEALKGRVSWQQEEAKKLVKNAESIKASHETVKDLYAQGHKRLEEVRRAHSNHRKRLLNVMRKVEVVRCMNQTLQPDEVRVMEQLRDLNRQVHEARRVLGDLEARSRAARPHQQAAAAATLDISVSDKEQLTKILNEHREELKKVSITLAKDMGDVKLIKERVMPQLGQLGAPPPSGR